MRKPALGLLFILFFFSVSRAGAEQIVSFASLEKLFHEKNLFLKARQAEARKADAAIQTAAQKPNPSLHAAVESLRNGSRETETSLSLSQPLDWTGKRRLETQAARQAKEAGLLGLRYENWLELSQVKRAMFRALFLRESIVTLETILNSFADFEEKNQVRLATGDIAEVDVMKLAAEKEKVLRARTLAQNDLDIELKNIGIFLNIGSETVSIREALHRPFLNLDVNTLTDTGLAQRSDIQAGVIRRSSLETSLKAAKREIRYPVEIEGGYKGRNGGWNGFVFGISSPLPWNNRNQGKINGLKAEMEAESLRREAWENRLRAEVAVTVEKMTLHRQRFETVSRQSTKLVEISRVARTSYEEGETALLDLLDALRAERELTAESHQAAYDYWLAAVDLETTIGAPLIHQGDNK